ncbi:MAG: methylaspartate mutase subunit E [Patescibacteria group bacterium]
MPQDVAWPRAEFLRAREEVLQAWPTGHEVDLEEAIRYQRRIPRQRRFSLRLQEAKREGVTLAQPRAGVALLDQQIKLLRFLQDEGGADLLPTTIDSYTRQNRYQEAQYGIEESRREGRSMLNGFPAVNYGVAACRRLTESVGLPVQVRHGTPDARLLVEICLAGGFTAFEGGGISYNIPYAKDIPLEQSLAHWRYVDRLAGLYAAEGVIINREPFGPLTGTLVVPCLSHAIGIIEALLAAAQGVRSISLGYGQCGNLVQDVAAVLTLQELGEEYLGDAGYSVDLTTVFHQWMGGFPQDEARAYGVIGWGAVAAALSRATKVIVKTPHEALGVPTAEANAAGLRATRQILSMLRDQSLPRTEELEREAGIIRTETRAILARVRDLGGGDWAEGAVRAFAAGVLDVPFAPSRCNAGRVMPVRDDAGAVRFLEPGNVPLPAEALAFERERIAARGRTEGRQPGFQMVIDDIYAIGKGMLVGRPR